MHSSGDASRLTALFVGYICPICAILTPCQAGASPLSVQPGVSPRADKASIPSNPTPGRRTQLASRGLWTLPYMTNTSGEGAPAPCYPPVMSDIGSSSFKGRPAVSLLRAICIGILVSQITPLMVDLPVWARVATAGAAGLLALGTEIALLYPAERRWSHLLGFGVWKRKAPSAEDRKQFRELYPQITVILNQWEEQGELFWDDITALAALLEQLDIWPTAIRRGTLEHVGEELKYLRKCTVVHDGLAMARERFPHAKTGTAPQPRVGT